MCTCPAVPYYGHAQSSAADDASVTISEHVCSPSQVVSCAQQSFTDSAWSVTPCWKLQAAPLSLLPALAYAPGSADGTLVVYAALQDKSVHKYRLNLHAVLTMKPKVSSCRLYVMLHGIHSGGSWMLFVLV